MKVQLVSTYELGHEPLQLASATAWLTGAGHEVTCLDLAVETLDMTLMEQADAIAISVPMHTASRLALHLAEQLRVAGIKAPIALYGLYANVASSSLSDSAVLDGTPATVDAFLSGEYHPPLVAWVDQVAKGASGAQTDRDISVNGVTKDPGGIIAVQTSKQQVSLTISPHESLVPDRSGLPSLERYARLRIGQEERLVGYVEATRGCSHRCLHCPVPAVYNGRIRKQEFGALLA
ncbi:MAG: hypothetical protein ACYDGY_08245, partial [Acidimicrobiales bacterium]